MDKIIKKIQASPLHSRKNISGDNRQVPTNSTGVSLNQFDKHEKLKIPKVIVDLCDYILMNGLSTVGIFRTCGKRNAAESLKNRLDQNGALNNGVEYDVQTVCDVLKMFLRNISGFLITEDVTIHLFNSYIRHNRQLDLCIDEFRESLRLLPNENYLLLRYLTNFLLKIADNKMHNLMDVKNLAMVFTPTIMFVPNDEAGLKDIDHLNSITTAILTHYHEIFVKIPTIPVELTSNSQHHNQQQLATRQFIDSPQVTQTFSTDGQKSSPSVSGDNDFSSSNNDNHHPVPISTTALATVQQAITDTISKRLSIPNMSDDVVDGGERLVGGLNNEHVSNYDEFKMNRTSSLPQGISVVAKNSQEVSPIKGDWLDFSGKSTAEPKAAPRTKLKKGAINVKSLGRKPLVVTQGLHIDKNDPDYFFLINKQGNTLNIDEFQDWNEQVDLDDVDGESQNDMKENSMKQLPGNGGEYIGRPDNMHNTNIEYVKERLNYIHNKLNEFKDRFERDHGFRPQSLEKTGDSQVQQLLAEYVSLNERLQSLCKESDNVSCDYYKPTHLNMGTMQSGISSISGLLNDDLKRNQFDEYSDGDYSVDYGSLTLQQFFDHICKVLTEQRRRKGRPEALYDMSREQILEEKIDLQKCLLCFEKHRGRPQDPNVKKVMKPLYDRYRVVKRSSKDYDSVDNNQVNLDYGSSAPSSTRSRAYSHLKTFEDNDITTSKLRKEMNCSSLYVEGNNNPLSQSYTSTNDNLGYCWKQTSGSGSMKSTGIPEGINRRSYQAQNISEKSSETNQNRFSGSHLKLKYNVPQFSNSTNPTYTAPSVHYSKSFISPSTNDVVDRSFKSCSSMTREEMQNEQDVLLMEKRSLQKFLKEFEHGVEKNEGRKADKKDRDVHRVEYDRYKAIKCRLKMLEKELESIF